MSVRHGESGVGHKRTTSGCPLGSSRPPRPARRLSPQRRPSSASSCLIAALALAFWLRIFAMQIYQNFIDDDQYHPPITAIKIKPTAFTVESNAYQELISGAPKNSSLGALSFGVAAGYTAKGRLCALAIARGYTVVLLQMDGSARGARDGGKPPPSWVEFLQALLADEETFIIGFDLAPLALSLFSDCTTLLANGVDLQSAVSHLLPDTMPKDSRRPFDTVRYCVEEHKGVNEDNIDLAFMSEEIPENKNKEALMNVVKRAWVAYYISTIPTMEPIIYGSKKVNTVGMAPAVSI
jgi:hypothetical protein